MKSRNFRDLIVWNKAHQLVLSIYSLVNQYPDYEKFGLVSQIRRSSVSICANIVEGYTKTGREFIRYLNIARASLEETKYHLILSRDLNFLTSDQYCQLYSQAEEIGKMLYSLKRALLSKKSDH